MPKRSRLAEAKSPVRLLVGKNKMAAKLPTESRKKKRPRDGHSNAGSSGFRWGTVYKETIMFHYTLYFFALVLQLYLSFRFSIRINKFLFSTKTPQLTKL